MLEIYVLLKVVNTSTRDTVEMDHSSGFVNAEMIEKVLFPPSGNNLVFSFTINPSLRSTVFFF